MLNKVKLGISLYFLMVFQVTADANTSSVSVDVGSDEQGNKSSAVSVVLPGSNSKEFMFGLGKSEVITGTDPVNNNFLYFGISQKV